MKPLRLIFLDIDGVLNSKEYEMYCDDIRDGLVDGVSQVPKNERTEIIRNLCEEYEIKIVISSSWRLWSLESTLKDFENYDDLKTLIPYIVGITPRPSSDINVNNRGEEIEWFLTHRTYPPIKPYNLYYDYNFFIGKKRAELNYCIIDDDSDILEAQKNNFINTYDSYGLIPAHIQKIKQILKII